jgi:hypothetical protein
MKKKLLVLLGTSLLTGIAGVGQSIANAAPQVPDQGRQFAGR